MGRVLAVATPILLVATLASAAPVRGNITLDDGDVVVTDSMAHNWPANVLVDIVKMADRSTRSLNVTSPVGGLMKNGDRVFITYKYLAWFGKGTLQGIWTLTGNQASNGGGFKYPDATDGHTTN